MGKQLATFWDSSRLLPSFAGSTECQHDLATCLVEATASRVAHHLRVAGRISAYWRPEYKLLLYSALHAILPVRAISYRFGADETLKDDYDEGCRHRDVPIPAKNQQVVFPAHGAASEMETNVQKDVMVIIGADRIGGVSSALAQAAALEGYTLELVGRDTYRANPLVRLLEDQGADVRFHTCDACDEDAMNEVAGEIEAYRGRIDAAVVTACDATGPVGGVGDAQVDQASMEKDWRANFLPAFVTAKLVVPLMSAQSDGGRLAFVSSVNAYRGMFGQLGYAVGKIGLQTLASDVTTNHARDFVRANVLVLTTVATGTPRRNELRDRFPDLDEAAAEFVSPLARPLTDFQAADQILLLVDRRSLLMGQVIFVDGGAGAAGGAFTHMVDGERGGLWFEAAYREHVLHKEAHRTTVGLTPVSTSEARGRSYRSPGPAC